MKKNLTTVLLMAALVVVSCSGGKTNENRQQAALQDTTAENRSNVKEQHLNSFSSYAISNRTGSKFLVVGEEDLSERTDFFDKLTIAIHNGKSYRVKFSGIQQESEDENNHRHSYFNFDNLHGAIFDNLDGQLLPPDASEYDGVFETILLVNQTFLNENKLIPFTQYEWEKADENSVKALEEHYKRKVMSAYKAISFDKNERNIFVSAQFENKDDEALGVYMVETSYGQRAFAEFPATIERNEEGYAMSVWQVDDDGTFSAPDITAVFKQRDNYRFLVNEFNAESVNAYFISLYDDKLLPDDPKNWHSRYVAPI